LETSGEADSVRRAHAVYYLGQVEERAFAMFGPGGTTWMRRLEREHDNFRAALGWARRRGETELGLRLASSLGPFYTVKGYYTEGRGWVEGLLALAPPVAGAEAGGRESASDAVSVTAAVRARALASMSYHAWVQGDNERAVAAAEEALALARSQQAGWAAGGALLTLGTVAADGGDLERATTYYEESVARLRAAGEPWFAAGGLTNLGAIALDQGDLKRATACCEECLAFAQRTGADHPEGSALACLADVARRRGDLVGAESLGRAQLLVRQRQGATGYLAGSLEGLALTAAAASEGAQAERAARLLGAAAALRERVGALRGPRQGDVERMAAPARAALGEDRWAAVYAEGWALSLEEAIAEALGEPR
jgi:tetratricopeptide (TPR) repeat protein